MRQRAILAIAFPLLLAGCKPDAAVHKAEVIDQRPMPASSGMPAVDGGTVDGTIEFKGAAPARVPIDMSMDPACAMSAGTNMSEPYVVTKGKLANVYVYVKAGAAPSSAPGGQTPVVLDQKGCRYIPHVLAVQQGGSVDFRNSDMTMHNVHSTPAAPGVGVVDISEQPGASKTVSFQHPELMLPIRCNNHPWMNAYLNVSTTPYFAVTGADGTFSLRNLPPGHYTIAAVQEKLGEQTVEVDVPTKGKVKANFTFAAR